MALNLVRNGVPLLVFDACRQRAEEAFTPALVAADLRQLAEQCSCIIFCLPNAEACQQVLFGSERGGGLVVHLKPGHLVIDCGTSHPLWTQETERRLKEKDITFLDAPISGMVAKAEAGTLTIMVGGDKRAFDEVEPVLKMMGKEVEYLGASGNGQLTKMLNNVLFNVSVAAMAEVLPVATRLGLDPRQFCNVVSKGSGQSFGFDAFANLVLGRNFEPGRGGYPLEAAFKDMQAFEELMHNRLDRTELTPVVGGAMKTYMEALASGLGMEHKGAMVKVWEAQLDVEVRQPGGPPQRSFPELGKPTTLQ